eukprot:jgi/Chlat1/6982/Chrsp55S00522
MGELDADFLESALELAGWKAAVAASAVCRHWRATSKAQDNLWRKFCEKEYPVYAERQRQNPGWLADWRTVFIAAHSSPGDNVQQRTHHPTDNCTLLPRRIGDKNILDVCFCGTDRVVSACWGRGGERELHVWNLLDDSCSSIPCGTIPNDDLETPGRTRLYWSGELLFVNVSVVRARVNIGYRLEVWDIERAARVESIAMHEEPLAVHGDTVVFWDSPNSQLRVWRRDLNQYKVVPLRVQGLKPLGYRKPSVALNAADVEVGTIYKDGVRVFNTTTEQCVLEVTDLRRGELALLPMALAVIKEIRRGPILNSIQPNVEEAETAMRRSALYANRVCIQERNGSSLEVVDVV